MQFNTSEYEQFSEYGVGTFGAIFAKKDGKCFLSFRESEQLMAAAVAFSPIMQDFTTKDGSESCSVLSGHTIGYTHDLNKTLDLQDENNQTVEEALFECAGSCSNKEDCVVLTGHGKSGAIANIAAIYFTGKCSSSCFFLFRRIKWYLSYSFLLCYIMSWHNFLALFPTTVSFGQPSVVGKGCNAINPSRYYRIVNSVATTDSFIPVENYYNSTAGASVLMYDAVPFWRSFRADSQGHLLITNGGDTGMRYVGLNSKVIEMDHTFSDIIANDPQLYIARMEYLLDQQNFPVPTNGFIGGTPCIKSECEGLCLNGKCTNAYKTGGNLTSCSECVNDSECLSGKCLEYNFGRNFCAGDSGKMDDDCFCSDNNACSSGRCELVFLLDESYGSTCCPKLANGEFCNGNNDCISGHCSRVFICRDKRYELFESESSLRGSTV